MKQRTKRKNNKLKRLQLEIETYKEKYEDLERLVNSITYLEKENAKLLDWIQKILLEFGTYEVRERQVTIPVMRDLYQDYTNDYSNDCNLITTEETIIPEIRISKMKYQKSGDNNNGFI